MEVSVVFATIDAIMKFNLRFQLFIILCVYILGTIITILIVVMATHEVITERLNIIQNLNNSQIPVTGASGHDGIPKYSMAVHVERV